eukprot:3716290-Pyramimonas_sp.AAC.1
MNVPSHPMCKTLGSLRADLDARLRLARKFPGLWPDNLVRQRGARVDVRHLPREVSLREAPGPEEMEGPPAYSPHSSASWH